MRHQSKILAITEYLEKKGQVVLSAWVRQPSLKPYDEHVKEAQTLADEVVATLIQTDIFVLISDPEGTDMFIELGVCLGQNKISPKKIYIVGDHSKRSLMQLHPAIIHTATVTEIFEKEKIEYKDFLVPTFE